MKYDFFGKPALLNPELPAGVYIFTVFWIVTSFFLFSVRHLLFKQVWYPAACKGFTPGGQNMKLHYNKKEMSSDLSLNIPLSLHTPHLQPPTPTTLLTPAENSLGHYSLLSKPVTAPRWSRQD